MATRGRKPTPTALKRLRGNPGKRKLNNAEPVLDVDIPLRPLHLTRSARKEWEYITAELKSLGILTRVDRAALAAYCMAWQHWIDAEKALRKYGSVIKTDKGNLIQSPYVGMANRAMDQLVRFAAEFGMTPSSRSRVRVEQMDPEEELRKLFGIPSSTGQKM